MPSPQTTQGLQDALQQAHREAAIHRHEYVTLEHVLLALMDDKATRAAVESLGGHGDTIRRQLTAFLVRHLSVMPEGTEQPPHPTVALQRVLHALKMHAIASEITWIGGVHLLVQLMQEQDSQAAYVLDQQGITSLGLKQYASHTSHAPELSPELSNDASADTDAEPSQDPLLLYTVNLLEEAAQGRIDALIGRDNEVDRLVQVLGRRRKNNPLLVGEAGVGKTAIAEGLAQRIYKGQVPEVLSNAQIYSLDMGALLAGAKLRGQFEQRLKGVMKRLHAIDESILYIDEIQSIVGAGATSGNAIDASSILKPALSSGKLRCIGSTTYADCKQLERDRALARRFQKIDVPEPSQEDTVAILKGLQPAYEKHHGVTYTDEALSAAVRLSVKHLAERFLPDKAIDIIDEAGSFARIQASHHQDIASSTAAVTVTTGMDVPDIEVADIEVADIERVVGKMARVPVASVSANEKHLLKDLQPRLSQVIFGQEEAIETIASAIMLSRAGLRAADKPTGSFLFAGPTGVGKTELAKQLANAMGVKLLRFDMSEYSERHTVSRLIGAPPGYVGYDQAGLLTEAVRKHPHSVVVLDELEKAHPDLYSILLQVMDHAKLTDNNGREADFRHVVLIMTTNAGASEAAANVLGFDATETSSIGQSRAKAALERTFTPEFRNRLDATLYFNPLPRSIIQRVVQKEINVLQSRLNAKNITLTLSEEAQRWLIDHGYDPKLGARPLARLIEQRITKAIAKALVFGALADAHHPPSSQAHQQVHQVRVDVKDKELTLVFD